MKAVSLSGLFLCCWVSCRNLLIFWHKIYFCSMKYFNYSHFFAVPSGSFNLNVHINSTYLFCIFPLLFCIAHVHLNPYLTGRVLDCQLYFALKHPTRIRILKCKNPIKRFASLYGISILVQVRPSEHKNPVK